MSKATSVRGSRPADFRVTAEKLVERMRERYESRLGPEKFPGLKSIEDLPLYEWTRRILRRGSKLKGRTFPRRMMEPPAGLDSSLENKTPQFFLRNVSRTGHFVEESPRFEKVETRDRQAETIVPEMRRMRYSPPPFLQKWNLDEVIRVRKLFRTLLHDDDWTRRFGRELKERVRGPLFKYDPDAPGEVDSP